jgi:hypothetical protein
LEIEDYFILSFNFRPGDRPLCAGSRTLVEIKQGLNYMFQQDYDIVVVEYQSVNFHILL